MVELYLKDAQWKGPSSGICPGKISAHRKVRETNVARVSYWFQTQETVAHIGYTGPTADSRSVCNYSARKSNNQAPVKVYIFLAH